MANFEDLGLSEGTLEALRAKGFEEPTPIQAMVIPELLAGDVDLVGKAQTGTGKTAAFGLPIIDRIQGGQGNVQVLILAPTRELALQVAEELRSLRGNKRLSIEAIYGGQSYGEQFRRLKRGIDIVVGTPGRILDHIGRETLKLEGLRYLVLDEADEMLNLGFQDEMEEIFKAAQGDRSVLLFSATMPPRILDIAKTYMGEYKVLEVESPQLSADTTDQMYFQVRQSEKFEALCRIIDIEPEFYGLVFTRTKVEADEISRMLRDRGYPSGALHGDITQAGRQSILRDFKEKRITVLVATDVAARGIDVKEISHVINMSLPQSAESYVHRIGRTGRAGAEGTAITFVTHSEYRKLTFIQRITKTKIRKETLPTAEEVVALKEGKIREEIEEILDTGALEDFRPLAQRLLDEHTADEAGPRDLVAALLKHFAREELSPDRYPEIGTNERPSHHRSPVDSAGTTRLFVRLGKKDGMTRRKLVQFIKDSSRLQDRHIDDVQVYDTYSFITVPFEDGEYLLRSFRSRKGAEDLFRKAGPKGGPGGGPGGGPSAGGPTGGRRDGRPGGRGGRGGRPGKPGPRGHKGRPRGGKDNYHWD